MKLRLAALIVGLLVSSPSRADSDYYKLERVKRIDKDLYSATSGTAKLLIETRYCYEYAIGSDATLKYDRYGYDNKIIFDDDTTCDVVKVMAQ